jgi:hypothetical protein
VRLLRRNPLLFDLTLQIEDTFGEFVVFGLHQEGVEPAAMIDGLERMRRDPQLERAVQRIRHQRHIEQIGEEPPLGLAVGMAHFVPDLRPFAGQLATPRHGENLWFEGLAVQIARTQVRPRAFVTRQRWRTYSGEARKRQAGVSRPMPTTDWTYSGAMEAGWLPTARLLRIALIEPR